jgi:hypothetical protein
VNRDKRMTDFLFSHHFVEPEFRDTYIPEERENERYKRMCLTIVLLICRPNINDVFEVMNGEGNPDTGIRILFRKEPRKPDLRFPS